MTVSSIIKHRRSFVLSFHIIIRELVDFADEAILLAKLEQQKAL